MTAPPRVPCILSLARSGRELRVPAGEVILEVLEREGVRIDSLCRGGTCGTCKALCTGGAPAIESSYALRQAQRDKGWILTCCARTVAGQRIVLEL